MLHPPKNLPKPIGFFDELTIKLPNFSQGSLKAATQNSTPNHTIAEYLMKGVFIGGGYGGISFDVLKPNQKILTGHPLGFQTDGHWFWPSELSYYMKTYGLQLPPLFIKHISNLKNIQQINQNTKTKLWQSIQDTYFNLNQAQPKTYTQEELSMMDIPGFD